MNPLTLTGVTEALRASWAADTCSPDDVERAPWSADNPAWGHCDITALVVQDLFGGDLLAGEVYATDGTQHGFHMWNRLDSGLELDLTREQFRHGQRITEPRSVQRPPGALPRRQKEYELLRERLAGLLGGALPVAQGGG
ncbi:hypothetical protein ACFWZ2_39430 [Streptomyces sp. NPDC059002]|uniref:YunG family protein n=1 Tax=Streptomyces sp. NPDC059002 TaxID=3346690 RepID=UPI00367BD86E